MVTTSPSVPYTTERAPGPLLTLEELYEAALPTPGRTLTDFHRAIGRNQYLYPDQIRRLQCLATPEKVVQANLRENATALGWRYTHFHDSRREATGKGGERVLFGDRDAKDFPDAMLLRGTRLLFVECKAEDKPVEGGQLEYLAALLVSGRCEVYILRPSGQKAMWAALEAPPC